MTIKPFHRSAWPSLLLALAASSPQAATPPACGEAGRWLALTAAAPQPQAGSSVIAAALQSDVVLLGEEHDNEDHHRWQLQVLAALYGQRNDLVIGLEMLPRRLQPVLDRWVQGQLDAGEFVAQSEWDSVWGQPIALYMPIFDFARINRIALLALNIDAKLSRAIAEKGWDAIAPAERESVGGAVPASPAYRAVLLDAYRQHPANGGPGAPFTRFVEAQLTWDRAMAEALAQRLIAAPERPLLVALIGSGHLRFGDGVARQLRDLGVTRLSTLLPVDAGSDCRQLPPTLADAVFALTPRPPSAPAAPRLGVQLERQNGAVRIVAVAAGSLAEQSGLRAGDQLLEVAGRAVDTAAAVTAAVRRQPPGTWLPLRVRRGDASVEVVVRFPPAP